MALQAGDHVLYGFPFKTDLIHGCEERKSARKQPLSICLVYCIKQDGWCCLLPQCVILCCLNLDQNQTGFILSNCPLCVFFFMEELHSSDTLTENAKTG